jgi:hypothetical protein
MLPGLNFFITIGNIAKMSTPIALAIIRSTRDPHINKRLVHRLQSLRRCCEESRLCAFICRRKEERSESSSEITSAMLASGTHNGAIKSDDPIDMLTNGVNTTDDN